MKKPFEKVSFFHSWQSFLLCFETNPCDLIHQNFAARVHLDILAFELCAKKPTTKQKQNRNKDEMRCFERRDKLGTRVHYWSIDMCQRGQ